jgi:hypothetical protein
MFTPDGHFSISVIRHDIPRFAPGSRRNGSAEENKAVVQGSINYFGTFAVNAGNSLSLHIVPSTFPDWNGVEHKRTVRIMGDQLKWMVPSASVGGTATAILERAKPAAAATTGQASRPGK